MKNSNCLQVRFDLKQEAKKSKETSGEIIKKVTNHLPEVVGGALPSDKTMARSIDYAKSSLNPSYKMPKSLAELELPPELKWLSSGTKFLFFDSGKDFEV